MKLLTILSGKFAYSGARPVHLARDGERTSLCGKVRENNRWRLIDDTPEKRKKYTEFKDICRLCIQHEQQPARKAHPKYKSKADLEQEKLSKWIESTQRR